MALTSDIIQRALWFGCAAAELVLSRACLVFLEQTLGQLEGEILGPVGGRVTPRVTPPPPVTDGRDVVKPESCLYRREFW